MADEAFALSPISARAAQPREEDYDAISEAFMETSRGRWFLGEYAKRNRNADTRMVLDAVARIEQGLAAQKQPAPDNGLAEALVAIRSAVDAAKTAASTALNGLALEEKLTPVRRGARIIHEIAWRWREIGADSRICDLIDSQISAIEAACGDISSTDPHAALSAAFDLIQDRLRELDDGDTALAEAEEDAAASPAPLHEAPVAAAETAQAESATETIPEAAMSAAAMPEQATATITEAAGMTADVAEATAEAMEVTAEGAEAADAHDEAVLDLIALEMGAPDPDFDEPENGELAEIDHAETHLAELPPVAPDIVAQTPEPTAAPAPPVLMSEPRLQPSIEPSLGSTLIASGMLLRPNAAPDPLAPIRRMSQAEKIAFFS